MLLAHDPIFLEHDTGDHPESAERLRKVGQYLVEKGWIDKLSQLAITAAPIDCLTRVHSDKYINSLKDFAENHGGHIERDTVVSPRSFDVARAAAGSIAAAVREVVGGKDRRALCLVRPPGHHAVPDSAMGFCLFNNIAVAARVATKELSLDRVLIVDWDVHHGNGSQDVFWCDEQVGFFSVHRWPFYPGTGKRAETGGGKGLGSILNLPLEFGTSRKDYLAAVARDLADFADQIKPDLVLVSAGFDSHRLDPIGSLGLEVEDFGELTKMVVEVANTYADGKIVSALEGGYNVDTLPFCIEEHLKGMVVE